MIAINKKIFTAVFFVLLLFPPPAFSAPDNASDVAAEASTSFIFVFRPDLPANNIPAVANEIAQQHNAALRHVYTTALKGFSATVPEHVAARMAQNPRILYYERNGVVRAAVQPPPPISAQAKPIAENEPAQTVPVGISRVGGSVDGSGRHAWIIDTGIDLTHADLNVSYGANFVLRGKNSADDGNGHGTHVAGIVGAINNAIGVVGVAANTILHPVRVLNNNGAGTIDSVIAGVDYVASRARAGDCANMSLGAAGHFASLHSAVLNTAALGIRFAIAAGNASTLAINAEPAHVEHGNIYTISAVDANDVFADFSNFGNPPIDFAAPGVNVVSTRLGGGVVSLSGTSMAAPHVCGVLLFGAPVASGGALNDPDGVADPVAHF